MLGTISGALARSLIYMYVYMYVIYISVAKLYGRFSQKLESLRAGQERIGQRKTGQGRKVQGRGQSKAGRAKQSRAWAKSRAGHDDHGHCAI